MIDILRSEWTKIRSVRSTVWTLAVTALLMVGVAVLLAAAYKGSGDDPAPVREALMMSLAGAQLAALSMATLGVLVISGEYRTGGIRTSLLAVPRRMRLLTAKIVVFLAVSLVVCALASAGAAAAGLAILRPPSAEAGEAVRAVLGVTLYLTACGLFGLGLGTLVRHTAGALVSAIALILVLPTLATQLPGDWGRAVADHFTTNAGRLIVSGQDNGALGPWSGFAVYLAWIAAALVAGAVLMHRRDA
ncbi:ABC transporter permease [Bailinhaonella thermotolerans]|uniref:ABC transporter permease n=1 Tax=Bailinhaonella thermotolerans TaxID=1070861 RepID=A0A3A4AF58_9ACTN|nr:ABC transporter permease [Bailinhaonella thermotolerans]RJL27141.1 ABC transporter permease [Bailinhaonella thermotolerans]